LIAPEKSLAMPLKVLILGGTAEAREIAAELIDFGYHVTSSLAGVTSLPIKPEGDVRVGGFGGVDGLRAYLHHNTIDVLIDATHPFAAVISDNAVQATSNTPTELVRFERLAWSPLAGDDWQSVATIQEAAKTLPASAKVFITTGRKHLSPFLERDDLSGVIRTVEPPLEILPSRWRVLLDRPPQSYTNELDLFRKEGFTHLVTKNAGGNATRAKLDAARSLGLTVVMVQRPNKPACETFGDIPALIKRLGTSGCSG
jgi:precorrin-6A/cobalt-precorrin-6A reductase